MSKRILSLLLAVLLVFMLIPSAFAENDSVDEIMSQLPKGVQSPKSDSVLSSPKEMYVMSERGNCIYAATAPGGSGKIVGKAAEAAVVTVYAEQDGYALAKVKDSAVGGWMKLSLLADEYYSGPNPADTANLPEGMQRPTKGDYLDDYKTMYVRSTYGTRIYLFDNLSTPKLIGYLYEGEKLTVIAELNGNSFIRTESGTRGWCTSALLADQ